MLKHCIATNFLKNLVVLLQLMFAIDSRVKAATGEEIKLSKLQQCIQSVFDTTESTDVGIASTATPDKVAYLPPPQRHPPSADDSSRSFTHRLINITSTCNTISYIIIVIQRWKIPTQRSDNVPEKMVEEVEQHWDCLIIGAGISGLDAAYHLKVCKIRMRETKEYSRGHCCEFSPHCEHFVGNKKLEPLVVTSKQTIL